MQFVLEPQVGLVQDQQVVLPFLVFIGCNHTGACLVEDSRNHIVLSAEHSLGVQTVQKQLVSVVHNQNV